MKHDQNSSADYVVYLRHNSSSVATGFPMTSADPVSLASMMRDSVIVYETLVHEPAPSVVPDVPKLPSADTESP